MMTFASSRACMIAAALLAVVGAADAKSLIKGGSFASGRDNFWATPNVKLSLRAGQLCGDVAGGTQHGWDALIGVDTQPLKAGTAYAVRFEARATGNAAPDTVNVLVQQPKAPWTAYMSQVIDPVESMQPFAGRVSVDTQTPAQLVFQIGGQPQAWRFCIDNVSMTLDEEGEEVKTPVRHTPVLDDVADPIRLNQAGYFAGGPKRATVISLSKTPVKFRLLDARGGLLGEGETEPRGVDPASGYSAHVADFSAFDLPGAGYVLETDAGRSHPFGIGSEAYRRLAVDALSWFYPQRSGILIDGGIAGAAYARPAGHLGRGDNRGDLAVDCLTGPVATELYGAGWQCNGARDVSGGWYDAGDHGKYAVNGGIAVAQMMAAFERAKDFGGGASPVTFDAYARLPENGNGVPDILDEARWELEFLLKMIVPEGQPLAGMANHKVHDVAWTALPMLPHLDPQPRALHRPSTAATLNVAAVTAQGARLFRAHDPAFADTLLSAARTSLAAAEAHPDLLAPVSDGQQGGGDYADSDVSDEFYWAAAELFITTGEKQFLDRLHASPHWRGDVFSAGGFDWKSVAGFARLQLGLFATQLPDADRDLVRASIVAAADGFLELQKKQAFGYIYAPADGLFGWGSNHLMLQNLLVVAAAHDLTGKPAYLPSVREGIDYIFGRNALNLSYVTGYGSAFSRNQHSRWYARQLDASFPTPPPGSLAGGPNATLVDPVAKARLKDCGGPSCYIDDIGSWGTNEITINWNAALLQLASFLADAK